MSRLRTTLHLPFPSSSLTTTTTTSTTSTTSAPTLHVSSFFFSSPFFEYPVCESIMLAAVQKGDAKAMAELMRQDPGFDVNMAVDGNGWTLLHHACFSDSRSPVIPVLWHILT